MADEDRGDGVLVLLKFFEISPASKPIPGVLVFLSGFIELPDKSGDDEELGCLRAISVADRLFVLLDKLVLDLLGSLPFEIRTFMPSSLTDFTLRPGDDSLSFDRRLELLLEDFLFWFSDLLEPLLDLLLILGLPLPLLLLRALESDFLEIRGCPFLPSSGFLVFWEVSSTEEEELLSLTFLTPPDEEILVVMSLLFSTSDVWRLKSPLGVVDWVILRLALGGWILLLLELEVGVLLADWLGVWEAEDGVDDMDSFALRFLLADGLEGVLELLLSTGDGDGESEPPFFSFFFVGIVGV